VSGGALGSTRQTRLRGWCVVAALLAGCATPADQPEPPTPQPVATQPRSVVASTAHPLATRAALQMLAEGGSAVDATVAAQMVLGLVEPQSSGIGGGLLMLVWDAAAQRLRSYDGLAAAPARTTASACAPMSTAASCRPMPWLRGGRSVGVPGTLAALELAHRQHGRLPWARLFGPGDRLAANRAPAGALPAWASWRPTLAPAPMGSSATTCTAPTARRTRWARWLRNPAYAETLRRVAALGVDGFWRSGAADRLVAAAQRGAHPSLMTAALTCWPTAPSERSRCARRAGVAGLHRWAHRRSAGWRCCRCCRLLDLRQPGSDRRACLDEPGVLAPVCRGRPPGPGRPPPLGGRPRPGRRADGRAAGPLPYLRQRAALIDPGRAAPPVRAGRPVPPPVSGAARRADGEHSRPDQPDRRGRRRRPHRHHHHHDQPELRLAPAVDGYVLNNALSNFSGARAPGSRWPTRWRRASGQSRRWRRCWCSTPTASRWWRAARPVADRSSTTSARALIEHAVAGRAARPQALAGGHVSTALAPRIQLEAGTPRAALAGGAARAGHDVTVEAHAQWRRLHPACAGGWLGAADPRRDGVALGQ
jgi:gamma-glutamyltranspeptidase/glutathione hydrolase